MPKILPDYASIPVAATPEDWAKQVRDLLGVEEDDLPSDVITSPTTVAVAEGVIIRRVPTYASITDETDFAFLKMAVICYLCYILAPSMEGKLKQSIQTLDMKWTNQDIDWDSKAEKMLSLSDFYISNIQSIEVTQVEVQIAGIGKALPKGMLNNDQYADTYGWWGVREAYDRESRN